MKTFEYKILRYLHDRVTGEFVNVGILLYAIDEKRLFSKTIQKYGRLSDFFNGVNGNNIKKIISGIDKVANNFNLNKLRTLEFESTDRLDLFIDQILPTDDSALFFTSTIKGVTLNFESTLEALFNEIVIKYENVLTRRSTSDEDAWKSVYKKYFDKYRITEKLQPHKIKTRVDEFEFDHCWKNDIWHIYKPISFDLIETDQIKDKIYRWDGIVRELRSSKEKVSINFLAVEPKINTDRTILRIINSKLICEGEGFKSQVVFEKNAEKFVSSLKSDIDKH